MIRDVNVVDVDSGRISQGQTLVIRNGIIETIGEGLSAPAGALTIDGRGKYVMPGLIDTHVHLTSNDELLLYAAAGVTTVQSLGDRVRENQARSTGVDAGALAGPGVVSCDYIAAGVSPEGVEHWWPMRWLRALSASRCIARRTGRASSTAISSKPRVRVDFASAATFPATCRSTRRWRTASSSWRTPRSSSTRTSSSFRTASMKREFQKTPRPSEPVGF